MMQPEPLGCSCQIPIVGQVWLMDMCNSSLLWYIGVYMGIYRLYIPYFSSSGKVP